MIKVKKKYFHWLSLTCFGSSSENQARELTWQSINEALKSWPLKALVDVINKISLHPALCCCIFISAISSSSRSIAKANALRTQSETNTYYNAEADRDTDKKRKRWQRHWDGVSLQMCIPLTSGVIKLLNRAQQECKQTKQNDEAWRCVRSRKGKEGGKRNQKSRQRAFCLKLAVSWMLLR